MFGKNERLEAVDMGGSLCNIKRALVLLKSCLGFSGDSVVKNLPASAEDTGLIPRLGRSLKAEMVTHSSVLAWKIPWTKESSKLVQGVAKRAGYGLDTEHSCLPCFVLI